MDDGRGLICLPHCSIPGAQEYPPGFWQWFTILLPGAQCLECWRSWKRAPHASHGLDSVSQAGMLTHTHTHIFATCRVTGQLSFSQGRHRILQNCLKTPFLGSPLWSVFHCLFLSLFLSVS